MRQFLQRIGIKLLVFFLLGMAFVLSLSQSVRITVSWWRGELNTGPWEWLWIGLLPVWLFVYFRYYSILRPGCRACLPPDDRSMPRHDNPGERNEPAHDDR
ncbi:MAG: hypothetical protein OEM48_03035 [Gammaproteobacteria bacterium]|nr:hypothetical protein [Gammaproteobacteria bacterium]MDH3371252.1 hypothetical protein [Gammaproteobacteria bacterium]MDH3405895.1 hypothetical protein [Gammaproteobacteria bacterium]MDH3562581.1 hypothetical protein [Gammaproteobacteria bacterium]MDH5486398.1 hypothetical protein [Gammaproteobacteria bacterium]